MEVLANTMCTCYNSWISVVAKYQANIPAIYLFHPHYGIHIKHPFGHNRIIMLTSKSLKEDSNTYLMYFVSKLLLNISIIPVDGY